MRNHRVVVDIDDTGICDHILDGCTGADIIAVNHGMHRMSVDQTSYSLDVCGVTHLHSVFEEGLKGTPENAAQRIDFFTSERQTVFEFDTVCCSEVGQWGRLSNGDRSPSRARVIIIYSCENCGTTRHRSSGCCQKCTPIRVHFRLSGIGLGHVFLLEWFAIQC